VDEMRGCQPCPANLSTLADMKKVITIIGARPQFIKCAPLSLQLADYFEEILVHTGQHYDNNMSRAFFEELGIRKPDYNLNVGSASHTVQTANIMIKLEEVIQKTRPDLIIVFGDTNSTLAGSLVGAKLQIPIAHVEAGLRSYNKCMPEELNRITADHYSSMLFCPGKTALKNLRREGIVKNVFLVGDVMMDALRHNIKKINSNKILGKVNIKSKEKYYFLTMHRQENTDNLERLSDILNMIGTAKLKVIFPIHPRTRKAINQNSIRIPKNICIIEPVNYIESLALQKNSQIIITDSGGIQKEAYFLGIPCITIRNETEWTETVKEGCNILTGADVKKFNVALEKYSDYKFPARKNLYGSGKTSEKIARILHKNFS
jgi:UDP-N-acetylglucosamine 2-epimerase